MTPAEQAAAYCHLRRAWPGLISQVRFARDDEPAGRVFLVRLGVAENLKVRMDEDSFDRAVMDFMGDTTAEDATMKHEGMSEMDGEGPERAGKGMGASCPHCDGAGCGVCRGAPTAASRNEDLNERAERDDDD